MSGCDRSTSHPRWLLMPDPNVADACKRDRLCRVPVRLPCSVLAS